MGKKRTMELKSGGDGKKMADELVTRTMATWDKEDDDRENAEMAMVEMMAGDNEEDGSDLG